MTRVVAVVTVLPPASWTATTGWVENTVPLEELDGLVLTASRAADPTVMVKLALTAEMSPVAVAVRVYVPVLSTVQPANDAVPATAALGLVVQLSVASPGVVRASVTGVVLTVDVLPLASWRATTGWVPNGEPPVELDGSAVNASWVGGAAAAHELLADPDLAVNAEATAPSGAIARATAMNAEIRATAADPVASRAPSRGKSRHRETPDHIRAAVSVLGGVESGVGSPAPGRACGGLPGPLGVRAPGCRDDPRSSARTTSAARVRNNHRPSGSKAPVPIQMVGNPAHGPATGPR